jgi:hypothetical protein
LPAATWLGGPVITISKSATMTSVAVVSPDAARCPPETQALGHRRTADKNS